MKNMMDVHFVYNGKEHFGSLSLDSETDGAVIKDFYSLECKVNYLFGNALKTLERVHKEGSEE